MLQFVQKEGLLRAVKDLAEAFIRFLRRHLQFFSDSLIGIDERKIHHFRHFSADCSLTGAHKAFNDHMIHKVLRLPRASR